MRKRPTLYNAFRRTLALVALAAFALHAFIPVGYMPDFSGNNHPLFALVICDGMDHMPMHHSGCKAPCPYSVGAIFGLSGMDAPTLPAPVFALPVSATPADATPYQRLAFANASPRSPPLFS